MFDPVLNPSNDKQPETPKGKEKPDDASETQGAADVTETPNREETEAVPSTPATLTKKLLKMKFKSKWMKVPDTAHNRKLIDEQTKTKLSAMVPETNEKFLGLEVEDDDEPTKKDGKAKNDDSHELINEVGGEKPWFFP